MSQIPPRTLADMYVIVIANDDGYADSTAQAIEKAGAGSVAKFRLDAIDQAMETCRHRAVDCILLEMTAGYEQSDDPFQVLRQLVQLQARMDVPVIVVSPVHGERLGVDAVRAGAQDFITKDRVTDGSIGQIVQFSVERYKRMQTAQVESLTDACTQLVNRRGFLTNLQQLIYDKERNESSLAVAVIDLDDFKVLNDDFGYGTGDQLLRRVGMRLLDNLRKTDCVGRLGSDEFALYLSNPNTDDNVIKILNDKLNVLRQPFPVHHEGMDIDVSLAASIGWAWWQRGLDAEEVLNRADQAMYRAKRDGKNRVEHEARTDR